MPNTLLKVARYALAAGVMLGAWTVNPDEAAACPPGCPSPVHPCCCPTPCPDYDASKVGMAEKINEWAKEKLEVIGTEIPAFDLAASPLSCLSGEAGAQQLAASSEQANLSDIGTGLGESGFTESPFALGGTGETAGLGDMFPIGQGMETITEGMSSDLSSLSSKLGVDSLTADLGLDSLSGTFSTDLGGLTDLAQGGFNLEGLTSGTGALGQIGELFPAGEGIDALASGMGADLSALGDKLGLSGDLGLGDGFGLGDLGNLGDLGTGDLSGMISEGGAQLGELFPIDEGLSQISQGMSDDFAKLGDRLLGDLSIPDDGGLGGILNGDFSVLRGPTDQGPETAGLDALFPIGDGIDAISTGMGEDLAKLQRDLGLASGGDATDFLASGLTGDAGSLQDLLPTGTGIDSLTRDLSFANVTATSQASGDLMSGLSFAQRNNLPTAAEREAAGAGMPEGMEQLRAMFPVDDLGDEMSRDLRALASRTGIESTAVLQKLANLGSLDGAGSSQVLRKAINAGDLQGLMGIAKVADLPGVTSALDLDKLDGLLQGSGIEGLGGLGDLGKVADQLPLNSLADVAAIPGISQQIGLSSLGDFKALDGLTSLGGFSGLADMGKITALANIPGVSDLTGIVSGNPQAAVQSLSKLASCAGASTPVTSAMIDSAGMIGSFQAIRNTLGGASGRDVADVKIPPVQLTVPSAVLPKSQLSPVAPTPGEGRLNVERTKREIAAKAYSASRLPSAMNRATAARQQMKRRTAVVAYARALQERAALARKTSQRIAEMEIASQGGSTIADDFRTNTRIRYQLTQQVQEFNDLLSHYLQVQAVQPLGQDGGLLKPGMAAPQPAPPRSKRDESARARDRLITRSGRFRKAAERAIEAHNAIVEKNKVADHRPALMRIVNQHENRKSHLVNMEQEIRSHLASLYLDPETAWQTLRSDLLSSDGTTYLDANKWANAAAVSRGLVGALMAQSPQTRYGKRIPTNCVPRMTAEGLVPCIPYTTGPMTASGGRGAIDSHYSGYQSYKPVRKLRRPTGKEGTGGSSPSEDALFQSLQYFLEARKRKVYWDDLRRGTGNDNGMTTTADLWNEFVQKAPECLSGPLATTAANVKRRPDMFDIAPDCDHREWSDAAGGFQGTLISHLQLGGVDQSLWMIKNAEYETDVVHGDRQGVVNRLRAARDVAGDGLVADLQEVGRRDIAVEVQRYLNALDEIEADGAMQTAVEVPRN